MMKNRYFHNEDEYDFIDAYELFNYYNSYFFQNKLDKCFVEWSQKMTLCAGTCTHSSYQSCTIRLSAPLLRYRTANELKQTLIHQMIHAFLFLTNPMACLSQGGHGPQFQKIMKNINEITQLNITVFHNFQNEVNLYRTHVWKCNGPCQSKPPFYGYVKRSINRKPQPADHWFNDHQRTCGGQFTKISGPNDSKNTKRDNRSKNKSIQKQDQLSNHRSFTIDEIFRQMSKQKPINKKQPKKQRKRKTLEDYFKKIDQKQPVRQRKGKSIEQYLKQMSQKQKNKQNSFNGKAKTIAQYTAEIQFQNLQQNQNYQVNHLN